MNLAPWDDDLAKRSSTHRRERVKTEQRLGASDIVPKTAWLTRILIRVELRPPGPDLDGLPFLH